MSVPVFVAGDQPTERPRPVTAYQRQKEREDARLRRKKAREKSKKRSKHYAYNAAVLLCYNPVVLF